MLVFQTLRVEWAHGTNSYINREEIRYVNWSRWLRFYYFIFDQLEFLRLFKIPD